MRPLVAIALLTACGSSVGPSDAGASDAASGDAGFTGPALLSETGLYADITTRTLAPGVMAYDVRYALWADGADKQRYLLVPGTGSIDTSDIDRWVFPVGTAAFKEFSVGGVPIETRMLVKQENGNWVTVAYLWSADGSDATAVPDGMPNALGTSHDVPSTGDCYTCHRGAHDELIGVSAIQLTATSLAALMPRLSAPPASEPLVPGSGDVQQALGYLHGNCGHCHSDDYPLARFRTLRLRVPVGIATPEQTPTYLTAINAVMSHDIGGTTLGVVPGSPETSQLYVRMGLRDLDQMPPLATEVPDDTARATVSAWISSLP